MDNPENDLLLRLRNKLAETLRSAPLVNHVSINEHPTQLDQTEVDFLVHVTLRDGSRHQLAVEFKTQGHPRVLRSAADQILRYRHLGTGDMHPVVAAPFITAEGAAVCDALKVGYCDLAGNCRLLFGGLYIERSGRPNPFPRTALTQDLYAPKAERILRVLLHAPARNWKVAPLAKEAQVSLGTVSTVRKLLLEREWAKISGAGIALTRPDRLLQDWADVWVRRRCETRRFISLAGVSTTESKLANTAHNIFPHARFAVTGLAAAWRHAQWVRYDQVLAYWTGNADELAREAKLKAAETGANVHLLVPRDEGVFRELQHMAGVPVVSPMQTYLDLKREPGRGAEAAEFLWNTVLFPAHATKQ